MQRRGLTGIAAVALLAFQGCLGACLSGLPPLPADPDPPPEPPAPTRPAFIAEPPGSKRCSFEESQRLTSLLEREKGAELRELADRSGSTMLVMVPLHLQYDGAGQVEAARFRLEGHDGFAREVAQTAKGWRIDGVHQAGVCDLAVQLPRSEEPPDAGSPRRRPPSMKVGTPAPAPVEENE
ncbi:MAG TPA: hypothetical protein VGK67_13460 [Myxococcales bacterium]|jgi:hypothetical protein